MIKECKTQHIYLKIPIEQISTKWKEDTSPDAIKILFSRFRWLTDRRFRIVNEDNLDCLFEMQGGKYVTVEERSIKLLSVVKVDNLHENMTKLDSP